MTGEVKGMEIIISGTPEELSAFWGVTVDRKSICWTEGSTGFKDLAEILVTKHHTGPEAPAKPSS